MQMEHLTQSRREFIQGVSILAGSTLLLSSFPWLNPLRASSQTSMSANSRVRIGIIGPGSRGQMLQQILQQNPHVEIVAVCDNYQPNLDKSVAMLNGKVKAFTDYRHLLDIKDIDAVVIATPLHEHAKQTIDAFSAGKHVFCEKSMAKTIPDCKAMYDAGRDAGKILLIGHQRLFNPVYLTGMEWIHAGKLGAITQIRAYWHRNNDWRRNVPSPELERIINWRLYWDYSLGLMTELASHQIQVANWALKETPDSVIGIGGINHWHDGREVHDNVALIYNYPSGTRLIYDSMISNKHYGLEEQILGPKGTIEFEGNRYYSENPPPAPGILQLINNFEKRVFEAIPIGGASWAPELASTDKGVAIINQYPLPDDTTLQMEGFVQAIRESNPLEGLAEEGYNSSVATIMGHQAMIEGREIKWPSEFKL
jgi:predicted dehydrogenase